uniref:Uncharacterized protein n=1 Tax=Anopheles minimus TaxID=112268 RepID=A0A182WN01_9DIPT
MASSADSRFVAPADVSVPVTTQPPGILVRQQASNGAAPAGTC